MQSFNTTVESIIKLIFLYVTFLILNMVGYTRRFSIGLIDSTNDKVTYLYTVQMMNNIYLAEPSITDTIVNYTLRERLFEPLYDNPNDFRVLENYTFLRDTFVHIMNVDLYSTISELTQNHYIPTLLWPVNKENQTYILQTQEMITRELQPIENAVTQSVGIVFLFEDTNETIVLYRNHSTNELITKMRQYNIIE